MNMDVLFFNAIFARLVRKRVPLEIETIRKPFTELFIAVVQIAGGQGFQLADHRLYFALSDIAGLIAVGQVLPQVILDQHLFGLAGNCITRKVRVTLLAQQLNNGLLKAFFGELHHFIHRMSCIRHCCAMGVPITMHQASEIIFR